MHTLKLNLTCALGCAAFVALTGVIQAQSDVTQPGDPVIASSSNSPGSEGVANAIDGQPTKYLNFDNANNAKPSGFVVTPSIGVTRVVGMTIQSANDAPERDPKIVTLEGSNDETVTDFASGTWELIARLDNIPAFTARFQTQSFYFDNFKPYKHYRWTVIETQTANGCCMQVAEVELLGGLLPPDVTQPGDPIIASSSNSPGSEGVANAVDGQPTKYLNFDNANNAKPSGFVVSPSIGRTLVTGMTIQSANDAPERDPKVVTLEGSNDDTVTDFASGTWELIVRLDNIPAFTARFQTQTFLFDNYKPYKHYRWTVIETQTANGCCMQVAEVELLGTGAPQDVTQPGDPILASSSNSPGSEGVANAIDGQPTKYLNFDNANNAKPSGFVVSPSVGASTVIGMTMQSANDAPERDPKVVTLEGSNDESITDFASGNWELIVRLDNVPAYTGRFQTQEFFFPNKKSYKHYRWTVIETQTANGCCMQIAEVELLAVTERVDCTKAKFLVQPVDTPVLSGAQATFFAAVNGPWPLQWYRNGTNLIPGATKATYTTPAVTAENAGDTYSVEIVGCEMSTAVKAVIFTPSATKSIGVSFRGGGANGAPTLMNSNDIAGIHLQAYWNNAANANSGDLPDIFADPPVDLLDSDNQASSTMTFNWTTSGTWGSGTGDASATQRLLNGLNYDNPGADPATFTFSGVPAGSHAVLVYAVSPPLQFQVVSYKITGTTEKTYYVRVLNSDEYNAAPGFYRGSSTDPNNPTVANFIRFDDVQPNNGTIILSVDCVTSGYDRGTGVNGIQLLLNALNPGDPPAISADPQPTVAPADGRAVLTVTATGQNLTYQWRKDGKNLPNGANISGATTDTLTISSFSEADQGIYSVAVFNPAGSALSKNAAVRLSEYSIADRLVGHWKLDESGGLSASNAVTGGKAAAVNGTASWGAGRIANAFSFDGNSYLFVPDYPVAKQAISASAWVNVPTGTASDISFMRNAQGALTVSGGAARVVGQFEMGLAYDTTTGVLAPMAAVGIGPNVARATGTAAFPLGAWHHIAFSADGAQLRLYVDGVEVARTDYLAEINAPDIPYISIGARLNVDTSEPPILGPDSTAPNWMSGPMDDIGLWTRALTADEVSKIYAAGQQGQALNTVVITPPTEIVISPPVVAGGNVTVTWTGGGTLYSTPTLGAGASWTTTGDSDGSYTAPLGPGSMFFQVR